jgi:cytochrome c biogenesis protein CcdA
MPEWAFIGAALWLGVLTSISPCPLATNVAAIAFLSRRAGQRSRVIIGGGAYTLGRAAAYSGLAAVLSAGLLSAPAISDFLRTKIDGLIGPLLILIGMVIAGWLPLRLPGSGRMNQWGEKLAAMGFAGEFLLGCLFALSFCPVSAAVFFGTLLPLVLRADSPVVLPLLYGLGTALPVVLAVALLAGGVSLASRIQSFQKLGSRLQVATGVVITAIGAWLTIAGLL